jgi:hypothetical protein
MKLSEYSPDSQQELDEIWAGLGTWLRSAVPGNTGAMAGGEREMAKYVSRFVNDMMRLAGRYKDEDDNPITMKTLQQLPTRALYLYMTTGGMKLPPAEIQGILTALGKNKKLRIPTPPGLKAADLNSDDSTIQSVWNVTDPKLAEVLIDKLVSIAALRKMEIDNLNGGARAQQGAAGAAPGAAAGGTAGAAAGGATSSSAASIQSSNNRIAMAQQALQQLAGVA